MSDETLPSTWCETTVTSICEKIHYGFTDSADQNGAGVKFLRISDIQDGRVDWASVPRCSLSLSSAHPYLLKKGDILFARTGGTVGKSYLIASDPPNAVFASYLIRLVPSAETFPAYIAAYFQSSTYWAQIGLNKTGLKTNVNASILGALTIPLPPLPEQKRIVAKIEELFSELEAGEASLRKARRQLGVYRQSLLKQAFEGKLTQKWRTQNPDKLESPESLLAHVQTERQTPTKGEASLRRSRKNAPEVALESRLVESLPKLPESWQWTALGNLTHLITKGSSPKWQGFAYTDDPSGVLFVTSENVRTGFLDLSRPKYLGLGFNEIQPASVLQDGDVLLNIVGASIGRAATFHGTTLANINQAVSVIRPTHYLDRAFLTFHLNSSRTYQLVTSKAVDVARANFSLADVNEIPVPLCSLPEQQEIVRLLDEQFEAIERNERELDAALKRSEALRQSILKRAFSGRLVPQDPTDEPASALLARLRSERATAPATKRKFARP